MSSKTCNHFKGKIRMKKPPVFQLIAGPCQIIKSRIGMEPEKLEDALFTSPFCSVFLAIQTMLAGGQTSSSVAFACVNFLPLGTPHLELCWWSAAQLNLPVWQYCLCHRSHWVLKCSAVFPRLSHARRFFTHRFIWYSRINNSERADINGALV